MAVLKPHVEFTQLVNWGGRIIISIYGFSLNVL